MPDGEHWDLMLERGKVLVTWQLLREPLDRASLPILAKRIGDHRRSYLHHEGPVSGGGGGRVRRVDAGTVNILKLTATECIFELHGARLLGWFHLEAADARWVFTAADS